MQTILLIIRKQPQWVFKGSEEEIWKSSGEVLNAVESAVNGLLMLPEEIDGAFEQYVTGSTQEGVR